MRTTLDTQISNAEKNLNNLIARKYKTIFKTLSNDEMKKALEAVKDN